ncbi:protein of unknown function [Burkholderia multivorans]
MKAKWPIKQKGKRCFPIVWSGRRVSNSRPQPWQGCALPTELLPHCPSIHAASCRTTRRRKSGAGDESRTRDLNLGKVALYQLSYSRVLLLYCHCFLLLLRCVRFVVQRRSEIM